ncbi:ATPase AAA [Fusobacterium nucleatum YWH7199]|uniref:RNA-binding domain-containing protein n=1 Tax=Fusobacterium TaxID=848 RepID=UPI000337F07B|nr:MULTISPECIES: RNA-binding domain-containing protein [Fusobacterium]MCL4580579.1 ATPase AAA [Fusobacterium nucleatum YWH7199]CDA08913.1 putative uncharacterized protein [Fusobacterium sp. CAG:649]
MNNEKTKLSFDLKKIKENENIELKKADNNLPNSLWETYSAFCNTSGGIIILGIEEKKNGDNIIIGINDIDKMEKDIWNTANNLAKVSYNVIGNGDIYKVKIDDKNIMILDIKEAPHNKKPVYLNRKIENTYIRRGEADKKADNDEIGTLMAMATPKPLLLDNFSMKDLDSETVSKFRKIVEERYPEKNYKNLNDEDFLKEIGAIRLDRKNNIYKITDGCLLLLGKYISITDYFSKFHLDFFYRDKDNERWKDRVSSDLPNSYGEMNIFNFYNIVFEKIKIFLKEPFALNEEKVRVSNTSLLIEAIREALVNTLIHADYLQNFPKVKIEMFEGWINFENSGKMLITKDEYVQGGNSVIRNEILVQLVRLIGIAERQGFGGVKICKTSESLFKQQPEIITDLRETKLKLWTVDALHFREDLSVLDKKIYHILLKNNQPLTRKEIISISENTEHFVKKSLINLLEKGLITTIGNGRSTKYEISFGTQGYLTKIQMKLQTLAKLNNLLSED